MFILIGIFLILVVLVWCLAMSCKIHEIDREDSDNSQEKELSKINNTKI